MAKIQLKHGEEEDALSDDDRVQEEKWRVQVEARNQGYPSIGDQLDMQYWDGVNGTTVWEDTIEKVKTDFSLEAVRTASVSKPASANDAHILENVPGDTTGKID